MAFLLCMNGFSYAAWVNAGSVQKSGISNFMSVFLCLR